jgi:hypothetical protein
MPNQYITHFKQMDNNQKETLFKSILKAQLVMKNYIVAIPEPDIGDDIWVTSLEKEDYVIHPAQIKSAFTWQVLQQENVKRYLINIKLHKLQNTLTRKYIYFFGLYDPEHEPDKFHIGCIPSSFFLEHWDFLTRQRVSPTQYNKRVNLNFDYYVKGKEYFVFAKPLVNIMNWKF